MNPTSQRFGPTRRTLDLLIGAALAHGAWSLWLWLKLVDARRGGAANCALGGSQCAQVWDSGFASLIQDWTALPVAGWGVVWSVAAAALALAARRTPQAEVGRSASWWGTLIAAVLGLLGVGVLALVMYRARATCSDCLVAYVLVLAYAVIALGRARLPGISGFARGAAAFAGAGLVAYLVALYPGLRTPVAPTRAALESLKALALPATATSNEQRLAALLKSLDGTELQQLSNELARLRQSPEIPVRPPRALIGPRTAPVRLTEFADLQCGHCAALYETLEVLRRQLGSDAFALEPRYFPLDSSCNPEIPGPARSPVRCTAAKLMICNEKQPWALELAGKIFAAQERLDEALLYELASPWVSRGVLEACVASGATEAHLRDDIDWAAALGIEGTPLVLVNGRKAGAWPPFLMAIVLAGGRTDHPLLAYLPPPRLS